MALVKVLCLVAFVPHIHKLPFVVHKFQMRTWIIFFKTPSFESSSSLLSIHSFCHKSQMMPGWYKAPKFLYFPVLLPLNLRLRTTKDSMVANGLHYAFIAHFVHCQPALCLQREQQCHTL